MCSCIAIKMLRSVNLCTVGLNIPLNFNKLYLFERVALVPLYDPNRRGRTCGALDSRRLNTIFFFDEIVFDSFASFSVA